MKRLAIETLAANLDALIRTAPKEKIILTRNGQPFAFVSDASNLDWEDVGYITDPAFWKMIAERRGEKTIPLEQVKAELEQQEKTERKRFNRRRVTKKARAKHSRSAA